MLFVVILSFLPLLNMNSLPNELVIHILSLLDYISIARGSQVTRYLNECEVNSNSCPDQGQQAMECAGEVISPS